MAENGVYKIVYSSSATGQWETETEPRSFPKYLTSALFMFFSLRRTGLPAPDWATFDWQVY